MPNKDEFFPLVSIDKIPNAIILDTRYGVKIYSPTPFVLSRRYQSDGLDAIQFQRCENYGICT